MTGARRQTFHVFLIQPSHYDDDGYVIQWWRSTMPSNTLAVMNGVGLDCAARKVLGPDVDIKLHTFEETNTRIQPAKIAKLIGRDGGRGLVGLVGVQTNQFPRAVDLARSFRALGLPVCIGGFHVSGSLAMLSGVPAEIREALDLGVSIFAGEAERQFDAVLGDAFDGKTGQIYNHLNELPALEGVPLPSLPRARLKRTVEALAGFDTSRGCPFQCSFCTIINVQGRTTRHRPTDEVAQIVRDYMSKGIKRFFITDDNFSRNPNWESVFDMLGDLRERENSKIRFSIQVDTLCHKIPNFIAKAARAGVERAFIGLETINPENLIDANKRQNRISEYQRMLLAWKKAGILTFCGIITGFPGDTPERVLGDVETLKRELAIDLPQFGPLTPLPGSADHKRMVEAGVPMDDDFNDYDLEHVVTDHPKMSREEWQGLYDQCWDNFYTPEHIETLIRRSLACNGRTFYIFQQILRFYGNHLVTGMHPLQGGIFRRRYRRDRRPGLAIESPWRFFPRRLWQVLRGHSMFVVLGFKWFYIRMRVVLDRKRHDYTDAAIRSEDDEDASRFIADGVKSTARPGRRAPVPVARAN